MCSGSSSKVFIHDAYAYFYGGQRDPIRQRLRDQLAGLDRTVVVLGHSLGSVIAYDVLHDKTDLSVQLFVTIGSPLAVPEVEGLVAHPLEVPIGVNQLGQRGRRVRSCSAGPHVG